MVMVLNQGYLGLALKVPPITASPSHMCVIKMLALMMVAMCHSHVITICDLPCQLSTNDQAAGKVASHSGKDLPAILHSQFPYCPPSAFLPSCHHRPGYLSPGFPVLTPAMGLSHLPETHSAAPPLLLYLRRPPLPT